MTPGSARGSRSSPTRRRLQAERLVYSARQPLVRVQASPGSRHARRPRRRTTLEVEDIGIVTTDGKLVDGRRAPTSEVSLHTLYCKHRPEVGAIVHTHGPAVMTMATLGWTLPPILTGLVEAVGGAV